LFKQRPPFERCQHQRERERKGETVTEIQISQPPSTSQRITDATFRRLCQASAWATLLLIVYIVFGIAKASAPAIQQYGVGFLTRTTWDPNAKQFSVLPEVWGTLYSSLLALGVGSAFGVAAAIFLSEGYLGEFIFRGLKIFGLEYHRIWG